MRDDFQSSHISTEVAKPQQVIMKAQVSGNDEVEFAKMDIDEEILLLKSYLQEKLDVSSQAITTLSDDKVQIYLHKMMILLIKNLMPQQIMN